MFRTDISRHIAREVVRTEFALLDAEDELANAQLRVKALRTRLTRLQGRQDKAPPSAAQMATPATGDSFLARLVSVAR